MPKIYILFVLLLTQQILGAQNSDQKQLTILYTNDLHAHLEPFKTPWISETRNVGGFANITTLVKKEKAVNPNALYFDAGDFFTGPYISSLTKGEAVIDAMNTMQIDAACIGNHEFDHGWQNVLTQFKKAKFPILNGNIFYKNTDKLLWNRPYKIIKRNGVRIGVIGMHGKFAFYDTISDEMIQGVEAKDEEVYLKKYIAELKDKTDIIVLLIHEGIPGRQSTQGSVDVARNLQKDIDLAKNVSGIDIIVTGHAHQGTPEALVSNGTIIVSTDAYTVELGKLDFTYDKKTDKITAFNNKLNYVFDDEIADDPKTQKYIDKWKGKLAKITNEKLCTINVPLSRSYGEESFMGDMVCDALFKMHPDVDLVVTNSGGLRQDIEAGAVTVGGLISAFPFPNTIVRLEMKGSDVRELFEHGANLTNGILQVSKGVEMNYDDSKPMGSRVTLCKIKGAPLDDQKVYKIVTSNFLADGGDGFSAFKNALSKKNTHVEIMQALTAYMKTFDVYKPVLEGRVVKVNK